MPAKQTAAPRRDGTISDQLRRFIGGHGTGTAYGAAASAGISPVVVARFLKHERGLTLETVDKLGEALGLKLVKVGRGRPAAGRQPE